MATSPTRPSAPQGSSRQIGARLSPAEREEMGRIAYFLDQWATLHARGLIDAELHRAVAEEYRSRQTEIERRARYREALEAARTLAPSRPADALAWAAIARDLDPTQVEPWRLLLDLLERMGRLDEAVAQATAGAVHVPQLQTRLDSLQARRATVTARPANETSRDRETPRGTPAPSHVAPQPEPALPGLSWTSIAAEFLEEHWQKLLLGLAVLLIVVSSTVGAQVVLGPRLWSPAGKCGLALVYTFLFAGLGSGLRRWGAERAGRMVLLTTLAVVPIHFLLAGELRLAAHLSPSRLVLLVFDVAVLVLLSRRLVAELGLVHADVLAPALMAIGLCGSAAGPGVAPGWGLVALEAGSIVSLGAIIRLNRKVAAGAEPGPGRETLLIGLTLLMFATVVAASRTGAVVLHAPLALYAVPLLLAAIGFVWTGRTLGRLKPGLQQAEALRFAGIVLSGLGFALTLARPPGPSPLYSGNTLATAVFGLVLYAWCLHQERRPAYLYFAFGALVAGYFGAYYSLIDLIRSVEESARQALGYAHRLPEPFKAINGLVFNTMLGLLALGFERKWEDRRLARHCHYLGLPLAIAAGVFSLFEPTAAVICLAGYAVLFGVGAYVFRQPALLYLVSASVAGLVYSAAGLRPTTPAALALVVAGLGVLARAGAGALRSLDVDRAYQRPLQHAGLAAAVAAMALASWGAVGPAQERLVAAVAFAIVAGLATWLTADTPLRALATLAGLAALGAWLCGIDHVSRHLIARPGHAGVALATFVPWLLATAAACRRWGAGPRSFVFADTLPRLAIPLVGAAELIASLGLQTSPAAVTWLVGGVCLLAVTHFERRQELIFAGLGSLVGAACLLAAIGFGPSGRLFLAGQALALGGCALLLALADAIGGRAGLGPFSRTPCRTVAGWLALAASVLAVGARIEARAAYPMSVASLGIAAVVFGRLTAAEKRRRFTVASALAVIAAVYVTLLSQGQPDPAKAYVLGLTAAVLALGFWCIAHQFRRFASTDWQELVTVPLDRLAVGLTVWAWLAAPRSPSTLALLGVVFLLLLRSIPATFWIYPALFSVASSVYWGALQGWPEASLMAAATVGAYAFWALGALFRRYGRFLGGRLGLEDLPYHGPFFGSMLLAVLLAVWLRIDLGREPAAVWTAYPGLPIALGVLGLLIHVMFPHHVWVYVSMALLSLGLCQPLVRPGDSVLLWLPRGLMVVLLWELVRSGVVWLACRKFPKYSDVMRIAADAVGVGCIALCNLVVGGTVFVVVGATIGTVFGIPPELVDGRTGWLAVATALCLTLPAIWGLRIPRLSSQSEAFGLVIGVLFAWWAGAPFSPLAERPGFSPTAYLALITSAMAIVSVGLALRVKHGAFDSEAEATASSGFDRFACALGFELAWIAVVFTMGRIEPGTVGALLLATVAFGLLAGYRDRWLAAYSAALSWWGTWLAGAAVLARRAGQSDTSCLGELGLGGLAAAATLWFLAGWLRRRANEKGGLDRPYLALALEQVALLAAGCALAGTWGGNLVGEVRPWAELVVSLGAAVVFAGLALRWRSEWLVYLAQAAFVGACLASRALLGGPASADLVILILLAYADLGLAEVFGHVRRPLLARPALRVALVLPLFVLGQALMFDLWTDRTLVLVLTASAFYAAAGRSARGAGYFGAVLANGFLWLAWARLGYSMVNEPQFYFVPVALSAILFAESHRQMLGKDVVHAIRGMGLIVIDLALALPMVRFESFGVWLCLLGVSMAGILAGIGLRAQSFLWLGLAGFVLDVVYQLGRLSLEHALARWAIMLALGLSLIVFVALNEKRRVVDKLKVLVDQARQWD